MRVAETEEDVTANYGYCIPAEWKLQKMYKQLKVDNNKFTTWLVESIYPCSEGLPCNGDLPPYITLSPKKSKGMSNPDRAVTPNAMVTTLTDHPKYKIVVTNIVDVARQVDKVPPSIMALLDRFISTRVEYSHWISLKSTDHLSKLSDENHKYYNTALKTVQSILTELEPETETSFQEHSPSAPKTTSAPTQRRQTSTTSLQGPDQTKAAKHSTTTQKPWQQGNWRKS